MLDDYCQAQLEEYHGFFTQIFSNGCGVITLNRAEKLNALNQYMLKTLLSILLKWRNNDNILFIVFISNCKKAFSAGGDMVELAESIFIPEKIGFNEWEFIYYEYRLDLLISTYNKPIISIINGIIMGGGGWCWCCN